MALAAQAQRPTANQQTPMFNWNSLAGPPPGGMAEDSSMALTMPMPVPAPVAMPAPPPAMPVAMPQQAPVPIPADQMVQQMYASAGAVPQQEMVPMPAPVYSMYPEAPQAPAQTMAPVNLPGPSLTDLAAYEMFGPPVVPGPGYAPVAPQPLPQQTAWQQEPVGYNPMMMDATASELYGMPVPQPMAAAPTQFGFDPSALTGAAGATAMQSRTAMPQPMMAAGAPPQELPPLPLPPSMYVPGRQQPGVMAQRGPATGAVMPYQPMTDLGVPAEDLYQMFAGVSPDQPLAMLTQQGGGEGQPPTAQPDQAQPVAPTEQTTDGQVLPSTAAEPGKPKFAQGFTPFEIPIKSPTGKEIKTKVVAFDPKAGTAVIQRGNTPVTIYRTSAGSAAIFKQIEDKYQEQEAEQKQVGPGNFPMLPEIQGMPLRYLIQDPESEDPNKMVWTPARQSENGLTIQYYDPALGTDVDLPLNAVDPNLFYMPEQQEAFGASAREKLYANLLPNALQMATGDYSRELDSDERSYYTPAQLAQMVQVTVEGEDQNGIPKFKVQPITTRKAGVRQAEDENGKPIIEEFDEDVDDPRVPPGYLEDLQKSIDRRMAMFVEQGEANQAFIDAKPEQLGDVKVRLLEKSLQIKQDELNAMADPASRAYKQKQKEILALQKDIDAAKTDMDIRVGAGNLAAYMPQDIRAVDVNPKSWNFLIRQVSGATTGTGPGSQVRPGVYLSPQKYIENFVFDHALSSSYGRGKSLNFARTPEYDVASKIMLNHLDTAISVAAQKATGGDPVKMEKFINDLYNKPGTFQEVSRTGKAQTVKQTFPDAVGDLTRAQAEMNRALASGETKRMAKAEQNLRRKFDKLRSKFVLPNNEPITMTEEAWRNTSQQAVPRFYDTSQQFDPTIGGVETQASQLTTIQAEKPEGFADRSPGSGPRTPTPTSIRPVILGAGSRGFRGDNSGVMAASATDPTQFDYVASRIGNKANVTEFSKAVMQGGIYGEIGSGFGDAANADVANSMFKGANMLMLENSPAGTKMRKAYGRALREMLANSSAFVLSVPATGGGGFDEMFERAYQTGDPGPILALLNDPGLVSRFGSSKIFQGLFNSGYVDYFTGPSSDPKNAKLYKSASLRLANAAKAIARAKSGALTNPTHPLGMNPIGGEQYVFFASPFPSATTGGEKSLLALPAVGSGHTSGSAQVLTKAQTETLRSTGQLPSAAAYDVPAAMLQLNSGAVFNDLGEQTAQAMNDSADPDVKQVISKITARQVANHKQDMSAAPARIGTDTNTKLDNDGKEIGRRWFIEGALIYNLFYPVRNTTPIP